MKNSVSKYIGKFATTIMLLSTLNACQQTQENDQVNQTEGEVNKLPDWAFGGFVRPDGVNPVISPVENTLFKDPMTGEEIAWESNDTFNPAATVKEGKIIVLYRAEDKSGERIGHRTSRLGYASSTDGINFERKDSPVFFSG